MKVIYITQTAPPEPGATKRPLEQAKVLVSLGHRVTLITAMPSYPVGRVFEGYRRRLWSREVVDGVRILRVMCVPTPSSGVVRRFASYVTFAMAAAGAGLFVGRAEVVIGSEPAPFSGLAALVVARIRRATFVFEVRDLMPDTLQIAGFDTTRPMYRALNRYYTWLYRMVDVFAIVHPRMAEALRSRGVQHAAMLHLPHATEPFGGLGDRSSLAEKLGLEDRFVVTYAGSFSPHYAVGVLVDAAERLLATHPEVLVLLVGTGADHAAVRDAVQARNVSNVRLTGGIDPAEVAQYLALSNVFVRPQLLPEFIDGTKIVEYLTMGKPVINVCTATDVAGQAETLGVGLTVPFGNDRLLAKAIAHYVENPDQADRAGQAAKNFASGKFDRRTIVTRFASQLAHTVSGESA